MDWTDTVWRILYRLAATLVLLAILLVFSSAIGLFPGWGVGLLVAGVMLAVLILCAELSQRSAGR